MICDGYDQLANQTTRHARSVAQVKDTFFGLVNMRSSQSACRIPDVNPQETKLGLVHDLGVRIMYYPYGTNDVWGMPRCSVNTA
jgi:hypothetical protein